MNDVRQLLGMIEPEFDLTSPLNFLVSVYKSADVPLHTRLRAAAEACKYSTPQLKAVTQVSEKNMAAILDAARERVAKAYNVIQLQPKAIEHDAAELKPDVSRSPGVNGSGGFRRRF
jgi:hypothetical protein